MFFNESITSIPSPSPQAVQSIIEVIDFLEKGDRKMAARLLESSSRAASPILFAADELRFFNDLLSNDKKEFTYYPSRMKYDWVHYAIWAIKLNLADLITDDAMLEAIENFRTSPPPIETSPELTACYNRFEEKQSQQGQNIIQKIFNRRGSRSKG